MKRRSLVIALSALLLTLVSLLGLFLGSTDMSFAEVLRAVFGIDNGSNSVIILRSIRLPRVVGGIFAGAALAASGLLLQSATGNDLVAPNVVGINSGAGLFVMLILCFFPTASALLPFAAFFGAARADTDPSGRKGRGSHAEPCDRAGGRNLYIADPVPEWFSRDGGHCGRWSAAGSRAERRACGQFCRERYAPPGLSAQRSPRRAPCGR